MGKSTGFLEYRRVTDAAAAPAERVKSFEEFHTPLSRADRQTQGARCMNCGVPFCQSGASACGTVGGCPLHNLIPEWNDEIFRGNWEQALARLRKTNDFPEFTGRVCPALCESACTCGLYDAPVTVRENELAIIEAGFAEGYIKPRIPAVRSGKSVAVVGSGPAGMAAADRLNQRGHSVTVFERDARPGGLLMYGIPSMKLGKQIVERRIRLMEDEGIVFLTDADIGSEIPADVLLSEFDAVVLCCGAREPRIPPVAESPVPGVHYAVEYLSDVTRVQLGEPQAAPVSAAGKHVVIIGGGDTGTDCVATCLREGCRSVRQLIRKPKRPAPAAHEWPRIPRVGQSDYGQVEAAALFGEDPRMYQTTAEELLTDDHGHLHALKITAAGQEAVIPCDLLLIAAGFSGCQRYVSEAFGLAVNASGCPETEPDGYATSNPQVFAAGDARRGASLVVWAIAEGRACAREVDQYLMGYSNMV